MIKARITDTLVRNNVTMSQLTNIFTPFIRFIFSNKKLNVDSTVGATWHVSTVHSVP